MSMGRALEVSVGFHLALSRKYVHCLDGWGPYCLMLNVLVLLSLALFSFPRASFHFCLGSPLVSFWFISSAWRLHAVSTQPQWKVPIPSASRPGELTAVVSLERKSGQTGTYQHSSVCEPWPHLLLP